MAHSKEKNDSTQPVSEKDLVANIVDKEFNITVLKMLRKLQEDVEKVKKMICAQNGHISKERENPIKTKTQKEIRELQSTMVEVKHLLEGFKSRFEQVEERIRDT